MKLWIEMKCMELHRSGLHCIEVNCIVLKWITLYWKNCVVLKRIVLYRIQSNDVSSFPLSSLLYWNGRFFSPLANPLLHSAVRSCSTVWCLMNCWTGLVTITSMSWSRLPLIGWDEMGVWHRYMYKARECSTKKKDYEGGKRGNEKSKK